MTQVYSWRIVVRTYELDGSRQVPTARLLNYLEEGAVQASAAAGYDYDWYFANHRVWVIRKLKVRYYLPVGYPDELDLYTWVSNVKRVRSDREYDLRRAADNQPVLRARANWVFINTETMQPQRIPEEFTQDFEPSEEDDDLDVGIADPNMIEDPVIHTEERRVQSYEIDPNGHVNHAVYANWIEHAITKMMRAVGWPPERLASADFKMAPVSHELEYLRGALDDEPVKVVTRLAQYGLDRAAWQTEILHGATGDLIARSLTTYCFLDERGSRTLPDALHMALVRSG